MKLRYIVATCALAIAAAGSLQAQKTADQLRIYINPGHGSWTANDRPMRTIDRAAYADPDNVDTTGFFETNTNIQKCLFLLHKLNDMGIPFDGTKNQENANPARLGAALDLSNNLVMSHVKAGPYPTVKMGADASLADAYNRSLSEISAEVDENNFDMFISIHSNANVDGDGVNYPLYLYRGADGAPEVATSDKMAETCWPYAFENPHMDWSYYSMTKMNLRGDWSFYGEGNKWTNSKGYTGYLGVLMHTVPGFLVEGYFHTYQPARYRAMNDDVCHMEGLAYARGICEYFGLNKETTGYIYGIVRDQHEKFKHDLYHAIATTNSVYKPLNGVVVTLKKGEEVVATYTTDNEYNGAFVFKNVEPGTYTLSYSHPDYKEAAAEFTAPFEVKANETSYVTAFLESTAYEPPSIIYVDYPDEINNPAIRAASAYKFNAEYSDLAIEALAGKTVRRAVMRNEMLYVLAHDADNAPYVYAVNTATKEVTTLGTAGTAGTELALSDITMTADGVLIGCARGANAYNGTATINIYKWANDEETGLPTGDPAVWFTSNKTGNFYNAHSGNSLYYQGTMESGTLVFTAETTATTGKIWFAICAIAEGEKISDAFARPDDMFTSVEFGTDYAVALSPRDGAYMVITGKGAMPAELLLSDELNDRRDLRPGLLNVAPAKVGLFKYAGHSFMVAPDVVEEKNVVKIIDFTNGMPDATLVKVLVDTDITASTIMAAVGRTIVTLDDDGLATDGDIELMAVTNGTITKLTTATAEQPKFQSAYAYNLKAVQDETNTIFSFTLNADAPHVSLVLTAADEETIMEDWSVSLGELTKGEQQYVIANEKLPLGKYSWAIEVTSNSIPTGGVVASTQGAKVSANGRGGVAVDNDPESPMFGNIYAAYGYSEGLEIFDPQLNSKGVYLKEAFSSSNGSSPLRIAVSDRKVYLTDWSDAHAGLWMFNPATPDAGVSNVFVGTPDSDGCIKNSDGVAVGGGTTGVAFLGSGADRKLYVFCEDYPAGNGQRAVRYDIGAADTWDQAPTGVLEEASKKMLNTNVEVNVLEEGVFLSQVRGAGNNNTSAPAFVYCDHDGKLLINGGSWDDLNGCSGAGLAISADKKMMAIVDGSGNIRVYDIVWNENMPEFTYSYTVKLSNITEINQLKFDYAGNLLAYNRKTGLLVIALPGDAAVTTTPGPESQVITGVEALSIEPSDVLIVYPNPAETVVNVRTAEDINSIVLYNLAGAMATGDVTVDGNNATVNVEGLPAGTYILKVNNKTAKVIKK